MNPESDIDIKIEYNNAKIVNKITSNNNKKQIVINNLISNVESLDVIPT